jgi:hypothetical protein
VEPDSDEGDVAARLIADHLHEDRVEQLVEAERGVGRKICPVKSPKVSGLDAQRRVAHTSCSRFRRCRVDVMSEGGW